MLGVGLVESNKLRLDRAALLTEASHRAVHPDWRSVALPHVPKMEADPEGMWESITGRTAADSHLAIVVPVRNEAPFIRSFLCALAGGLIPDTADVKIMIVTNGSSDKSAEVIDRFLGDISGYRVEMFASPRQFDSGLHGEVRRVRIGRIALEHYVTSTAGKVPALLLANRLAHQAGYEYMVSFDSDCTPEPLAVAQMFATMSKEPTPATCADGRPPVLAYGKCVHPAKNPVTAWMHRNAFPLITLSRDPSKWSYPGPIMGWKTDWISSGPGIPATVNEDRGLAIRALSEDQPIGRSEATTWFRHDTSFGDMLRRRVRYLRGVLQLFAEFPDAKARSILNEMYGDVFPDNATRRANFRHEMLSSPSLRLLGRFTCLEFMMCFARRELRRAASQGAPLGWAKLESSS